MSFIIIISILFVLLVDMACFMVSKNDELAIEEKEDLRNIPDYNKSDDTNEHMCSSCRHNEYCIAAFQKDHWCGNHRNMQGL